VSWGSFIGEENKKKEGAFSVSFGMFSEERKEAVERVRRKERRQKKEGAEEVSSTTESGRGRRGDERGRNGDMSLLLEGTR